MKSQTIRLLVEKAYGLNDLTLNEKSHQAAYRRYVYFTLCDDFTDETLEKIGKTVGQTYATVLHGKNKFQDFKDQNFYKEHWEIYEQLYDYIKDHPLDVFNKDSFILIEKTYKHELKSIIRSHENHLKSLKKGLQDIEVFSNLNKIALLEGDKLTEFNAMCEEFFKKSKN